MTIRSLVFGLLVLLVNVGFAQKTQFSRTKYYAAMAADNLENLVDLEKILSSGTLKQPNREAFQGALLMKKAGLLSGAREKLNVFKTGHQLLEKEIKNDADNVELRFLRLMIQEHAPKVVRYRDNIEEDRRFITEYFYQLKPEVQQAVLNYSKQFKTLQPSAFNQAPS